MSDEEKPILEVTSWYSVSQVREVEMAIEYFRPGLEQFLSEKGVRVEITISLVGDDS